MLHHMKRYLLLLVIVAVTTGEAYPLDMAVSIYHDRRVKAVLFSAYGSDYRVSSGEKVLGVCPGGESWYLLLDAEGLRARDQDGRWQYADSIRFESGTERAYFAIKPVEPLLGSREYHGRLLVRTGMDGLQMLNLVDLEKYIMGVTETEAGTGSDLEFYKVQAILCRTYALKNMDRHASEGFHLCDGIHCQAYSGRHVWSEDVEIGVEVTNGMVLTDGDSMLINAAYHSNSGGETRDAGQVWLREESYLRPVLDRFSLGQPNARWKRRIPLGDWISYLHRKGILEGDLTDTSALDAVNEHRRPWYCPLGDSISCADIRGDWQLRSDFFNVSRAAREIILDGRGYGHGVGLSQEGAMQMARNGYHYTEILNFYYHDIRVVHYLVLEDSGVFQRKVLFSH